MTKTIDALVEALEELLYADTEKARGLANAALARAEQAQELVHPYAYLYEFDTAVGLHQQLSSARWNGMKPTRSIPLYTSPQPAKLEPLRGEEIYEIAKRFAPVVLGIRDVPHWVVPFGQAIEAAHNAKLGAK